MTENLNDSWSVRIAFYTICVAMILFSALSFYIGVKAVIEEGRYVWIVTAFACSIVSFILLVSLVERRRYQRELRDDDTFMDVKSKL